MDFEKLREYLREKNGATEEFPFGPDVMVFKVMNKMFALLAWGKEPMQLNLKCDPDLAIHLRNLYPAVIPGYHMSKKHWNTLILDGSLPEKEILAMADDSYDLVVKGLSRRDRRKLGEAKDEA